MFNICTVQQFPNSAFSSIVRVKAHNRYAFNLFNHLTKCSYKTTHSFQVIDRCEMRLLKGTIPMFSSCQHTLGHINVNSIMCQLLK